MRSSSRGSPRRTAARAFAPKKPVSDALHPEGVRESTDRFPSSDLDGLPIVSIGLSAHHSEAKARNGSGSSGHETDPGVCGVTTPLLPLRRPYFSQTASTSRFNRL
jgi:hypothetical protein